MKLLRRALMVLVASTLAAVLAFLYYKTTGIDFGQQIRVAEELRALKLVDAKWNEAIVRSRGDVLGGDDVLPTAREDVARAVEALKNEAIEIGAVGLADGVGALETAFAEKATAMREYQQVSSTFKNALQDVFESVSVAQAQLRDAPGAAGKAADTLRQALDRIQPLAMEFGARGTADMARSIEESESRLTVALESLGSGLREPVELAARQLRTLRELRPKRDELYNRLYYFPTGPKTDSLGIAFGQAFQQSVEERELYRIYLIFFSGALLVFLAYIGAQLVRSYRVINDVNQQLKRANESLEGKVEERTRELTDALRHLKESEALLVQTEKMSSLGQMVAGVAHEINTPLAYVKSSLEAVQARLPELGSTLGEAEALLGMLAGGQATEEQVAEQFARVAGLTAELREQQVAQRLGQGVDDGLYGITQISELVSNLKNFSRLDRNKVARFDLREGIDSTLQIARNAIKTKQVVKRYGDIPQISCSPSQVNQVFLNLVTNAAQATPEPGGVITITTRRSGNSAVAVDVEDNGHGIPPDVLPKIFDPFFTTKDVGKGTGLGLSICYKIVQQHGGRIDVQSEVGRGTRFTVTLPVDAAPELAAA
jgi:two-component system, NtrC family, sensor kinase